MISKKIKYEDYNGETVEKTFHFHLNKSEITKMEYQKDGTRFSDILTEIGSDNVSVRRIIDIVEDLFRRAVGEKSEDGRRFIKNDDVRSELFDTEAYGELLSDLLTAPEDFAKFIQGMMPKDAQQQIEKKLPKGSDISSLSREELLELAQNAKDD